MLKPIEYYKGAKGIHPTVLCECDCGNIRVVRQTRLRLGKVTMCAACSKAEAAKRGGKTRRRFSKEEVLVREKLSQYKQNAKKRSIAFDLTDDEFVTITSTPCRYCGESSCIGIDRLDNSLGYTLLNSVSCCSKCNYAKRDMSESEFINLVERIYAYQSR